MSVGVDDLRLDRSCPIITPVPLRHGEAVEPYATNEYCLGEGIHFDELLDTSRCDVLSCYGRRDPVGSLKSPLIC